jgi:methylmalonyl-CoA mutase C-terminal domain/subunit
MSKKKIKTLLVKGGLDGHDRGIKIVARALRDAGVEVVYGGLYCSPEEIVTTALQEDADLIGISIHSNAHLGIFSEVLKLLKKKTGENRIVFGGGVIPKKDIPLLEKMGVKKIFLPGTDTKDIVKFVLEVQNGF